MRPARENIGETTVSVASDRAAREVRVCMEFNACMLYPFRYNQSMESNTQQIIGMAVRMHQEEARLNCKMVTPLNPDGLAKIVEAGLVDGDTATFGKYRFWLGI